MSSSMYNVSPTSLHDLDDQAKNSIHQPRRIEAQSKPPQNPLVTPESNFLSPFSSNARSSSASPVLKPSAIVDAVPTTELYAGSVYADIEDQDDPFLGANFDHIPQYWSLTDQAPTNTNYNGTYPPSLRSTTSFPAHQTFETVQPTGTSPGSQESEDLPAQPEVDSINFSLSGPQLTLDTNRDSFSTNGSPARATPATLALAAQSPRVMVSMWGKDDDAPILGAERSFASSRASPPTVRPSHSVAGDLAYERPDEYLSPVARDTYGDWMPNQRTGHRGLAPEERPEELVLSPNQLEAQRRLEEKNRDVGAWLFGSARDVDENNGSGRQVPGPEFDYSQDNDDNIPAKEIPFGDTTENKYVNGQTYFVIDGPGGPITKTDYEFMQYRTWEDPPTLHAIQNTHLQPETSQAAIERFHRQCADNSSIISKRATWGTRRRSLPSSADIEDITTGNLLKKLNINSSSSRRPSLLQRVASLSRKTSLNHRKRKGSNASEQPPDEDGERVDRRDSKEHHTPSRTSGWMLGAINKRQPHPSLSSAVVAISTGATTIATQHASPTHKTSPRSPFASLSIRRPRSKTELPKPSSTENTHPNLVEMLKVQGGVPVAQLARPQPPNGMDDDEDEDDEDDLNENDLKDEHERVNIIEPTLNGFRAHILACNPGLANAEGADRPNNYLVERMAQQLLNRFHQLLIARQNHMKLVSHGGCPSGALCRSNDGTPKYQGTRVGSRGAETSSASALSPDEENIPLEGCISADRFPRGIILPPTPLLPAEFECPLCFTVKKFQKPSDWTKHVHEDLQPFTCTWDRCREPKMFKRKADWVRHENEGHRQLEWWICDVDDCRHVCYRRDNFLQHLVREHKFAEPKIKTKVAIKKASGVDYTWQKVEHCHRESPKKPTEEPCCFCGKTLATWKKLTVHLAKHMEQISLPILGLVMGMELDLDTVIGPVQAPLPRQGGPHLPQTTPFIKSDSQDLSPRMPDMSTSAAMAGYSTVPNHLGVSHAPYVPMSNAYYTQQPTVAPHHDMPCENTNLMMQAQYSSHPQYLGLPVPPTTFGQTTAPMYAPGMPVTDIDFFPEFDSLGVRDMNGNMGFQSQGNPTSYGSEQYGPGGASVPSYLHSSQQNCDGQFYNS